MRIKHIFVFPNMARILWAILFCWLLAFSSCGKFARAATLLPNGEQTFLDADGNPLAGGKVYFYIPSTTSFKATWQNAAQSVLNTNPVVLDSAGRAIIYGAGTYRQLVKDSLDNVIWDQLTTDTDAGTIQWAGQAGGSANVIALTAPGFTLGDGQEIQFQATATNTSAVVVVPNAAAGVAVVKDTDAGPIVLTGGEIVSGNVISIVYVQADAMFHLVGYPGQFDLGVTCLTLEAFGGSANGVVDNSSAMINALNALGITSNCLLFGPGTYLLSSNNFAKTLVNGQSLTMQGSGAETTELRFANVGDGFDLTLTTGGSLWATGSGVTLTGFTMSTAQANAGVAISIAANEPTGNTGKPITLQGLVMRPSSSALVTAYWTQAIRSIDAQNVNLSNVSIHGCNQCYTGTGIHFGTSSIANASVILTMSQVFVEFAETGVLADGDIVEGLTITNSNFNHVVNGVRWNSNANHPQCSIMNSQIEARDSGIHLTKCTQGAVVGNLVYIGKNSAVAGSPGIHLEPATGVTVIGNNVNGITSGGNVPNCVVLAAGAVFNQISLNVFQGCGTNIWLQVGADTNKLVYNVSINGTPVLDAGAGNTSVGN